MRDRRRFASGTAILAGLLALTSGGASPAGAADDRKGLVATLEVTNPFTYEGDPLKVRVAVFNTSDQPWVNSSGINLLGGLRVVSAAGGKIGFRGKPEMDVRKQPPVVPSGGFFGIIHDLASLMPDVSRAGTYTISWEEGSMSAGPITVKVIPRFEASAAYVAVVETDYGYLEFDLLTKEAPRHVQNFYDLALQGFYDNSVLHQVVKGVEVRGGDPSGSGNGWPGYAIDPEISRDLKHARGTLAALRMPGQNQDNGSQFVITLGPNERYDGNLSIFGQMKKGDDVLQAIENIPTSGQRDFPYFRPIKPIVVRSITVKKAGASGSRSGS